MSLWRSTLSALLVWFLGRWRFFLWGIFSLVVGSLGRYLRPVGRFRRCPWSRLCSQVGFNFPAKDIMLPKTLEFKIEEMSFGLSRSHNCEYYESFFDGLFQMISGCSLRNSLKSIKNIPQGINEEQLRELQSFHNLKNIDLKMSKSRFLHPRF